MKKLVKATSLLASVSFTELMVRFVRTKCLAIFLGPVATGIVAQLAIFFETIRVWADLGTRRAVFKQIGESRAAEGEFGPRYRQTLRTAFTLLTVMSFATALFTAVFSNWISWRLFGHGDYSLYIAVTGFTLPLVSWNALMASILKANMAFGMFARYTASALLVLVVLTPPAVYYMEVWGAILIQALFFALPILAYLAINRKSPFLLFSERIDLKALVEMLQDGFNFLYQSFVSNGVKLVLATWITKELGLDQMGYYQVALTCATVYLMIPVQSVSGVTLPAVAAATSNGEIRSVINNSIRLMTLLLMPAVLFLMVWPETFILVFYSPAFLAAALVLKIQLISTIFDIMCNSLGAPLAAKGRFKILYIFTTLHAVAVCVTAWIFFPRFGLLAIAGAFAFAEFLMMLALYFILKAEFDFSFTTVNRHLMVLTTLWTCLVFAVTFVWPNLYLRVLVTALTVPWALFCLTGDEKTRLRTLVCSKLGPYLRVSR